jgi:hypothetical protein
MDTTIVALDLVKFNSVLCWYEPISRPTSTGPNGQNHECGLARHL